MSCTKVILSVMASALLAIAWVLLRQSPSVQQPGEGELEVAAPASGRAEPRGAAEAAPASTATQTQPTHAATPASISDEFKRATDYFDFASSIHERAKNGDADAQYYLYATLAYCNEKYRFHFHGKNGRTRTLEEALHRASTRQSEPIDIVRTAYERCSKMFEEGSQSFGSPDGWLKLATASDQPLALVTTATQLLLWPTQAPAGGGDGAKPLEMLTKALRDKDPEVMWKIGEVQALLDGDEDEQMLRQWAWWLAACQRGYDCGKDAVWMEYACSFDQLCGVDKDAVDYIRRMTDLDYPAVESRAREINENIDTGSWDALGLTYIDNQGKD